MSISTTAHEPTLGEASAAPRLDLRQGRAHLFGQLRRARGRTLTLGLAAAPLWALAAAIVVALLGGWIDLLWELSPAARFAVWFVCLVVGCAIAATLLVGTLRGCRARALARRLDAAEGGAGHVLTGLELDQAASRAGPAHTAEQAQRREALARIAVAEAGAVAAGIPVRKAVSPRWIQRGAMAFGLAALVTLLLTLVAPRLVNTQLQRLISPYADTPPFAWTTFDVAPGDAEVLYGSDLEIIATPQGSPVDRLNLVLEGPAPQSLPMFAEEQGRWRAVLTRVVEPATYHVEAPHARSNRFSIHLLTVPQIEQVRVAIDPPKYSGWPSRVGPPPREGIAGLRGTRVTIYARSNRPLAGGELGVFVERQRNDVPMTVTADEPQTAVGTFEIEGSGHIELQVTDADGQRSQQAVSLPIALMADQKPLVRILQPTQLAWATPAVTLPVELAAEDDCGLSRLQLFRSLNDSRPLPMDCALPVPAGPRARSGLSLPLAAFELAPGDVLKLFARVEDNDPIGGKGSESSTVTVHIISQADFDKMLLAREGLEVLISKYEQGQRQMESLANKLAELEARAKELAAAAKEDAGQKNAEEEKALAELREQIESLEKELQAQSEAVRRALEQPLPFDLDRQLAPQLKRVADELEAAAKALQRMAEKDAADPAKLAQAISALREQIAKQREDYRQQVQLPLEALQDALPLMADAERFKQIAAAQKDLADRLKKYDGQDSVDDPAVKARMRDLEDEQRRLRESLDRLLDDIEDHATQLPDRAELGPLRATAERFAAAVRQSGATETLGDAESALAVFYGTHAYNNARRGAELLDRFIERSGGGDPSADDIRDQAGQRFLTFQPSIADALQSTAGQLLGGQGSSSMGRGDQFRSSMYGQSPLQSALYGDRPRQPNGRGGGRDGNLPGGAGGNSFGGVNPDQFGRAEGDASVGADGLTEAAVPVQYRRRVAQYFQRVNDESTESTLDARP